MNNRNSLPMVSIVIPCWNAEAHIADAIGSALGQSYPNKEIIVVNDGSTDASAQILSSFDDVIVINQKNKGAPAARNAGIYSSSGEYIKFLDADDILDLDCLSNQIKHQQQLHSNEISYGNHRVIYANNPQTHQPKRGITQRNASLQDLVEKNILTSLPLYPRSALIQISGFDTRLKSRQEWNLNIRLKLLGYDFVFDNVSCYTQRYHHGIYRISNRKPSPSEEFHNIQCAIEPLSLVEDLKVRSVVAFRLWNIGRWYAIKDKTWAKKFFSLAESYDKKNFKRMFSLRYKISLFLLGVVGAELIERALTYPGASIKRLSKTFGN